MKSKEIYCDIKIDESINVSSKGLIRLAVYTYPIKNNTIAPIKGKCKMVDFKKITDIKTIKEALRKLADSL